MRCHENPELSKAFTLMAGALQILDEVGAPGEIGSHLDLALARLRSILGLEIDRAALPEEWRIALAMPASTSEAEGPG